MSRTVMTPAGKTEQSQSDKPTLLVFADDWGRHPSSCQHLVKRLTGRFHVVWANTIGMRPPSFGWSTLFRGLEKIRHWTKSTTTPETETDIEILNPKMWPWFRRAYDRAINRRLLGSQLRAHLKDCNEPVVAITTIPIVADFMDDLPVDRWVYYCVDDFGTWPGLDQKPLVKMETKLIQKSDILIAASQVLKKRLEETRDSAALLTHGVDLDHWSLEDVGTHPALRLLESPIVSFWGLVDRRMDRQFLEVLSRQMARGTIALVGPDDNPDSALQQLPRVQRVAALPYKELPQIAAGSDALILPYIDAPVTQAMQPLKLLEYLATGRPVIARDLPATQPWSDGLDLASDAETFTNSVLERVETGLPPEQRRARERLSTQGWEARALEFENLLFS